MNVAYKNSSELFKINGSICKIPVQAANICNILPRQATSNVLLFGKLKRDLKYSGHVFFEPVRVHIIYQVLASLKSHNKFHEDISITKGLSSGHMIRFSNINVEIWWENESVTENITLDRKEINYLKNKTE